MVQGPSGPLAAPAAAVPVEPEARAGVRPSPGVPSIDKRTMPPLPLAGVTVRAALLWCCCCSPELSPELA